MRAVLQRVKDASVTIDGEVKGKCSNGFLAKKIANLRVFTDENDKMNLSLLDIKGETLVISNFTLYADCSHGRRPNFLNAEKPDKANALYEYFCDKLHTEGISVVEKGGHDTTQL